jgi:hypothetical protein
LTGKQLLEFAMSNILLLAPFVALAASFLLIAVVTTVCLSQPEVPVEAKGFALRRKRLSLTSGATHGSSSAPKPSGKRVFQAAAA